MNNNKDTNTNFWISYADLMAGLLFVFILLIGAIIVKYSLLQSESKILEQTLEEEKLALEKNRKELALKEEKIKNVAFDLRKTRDLLQKVEADYEDTQKNLKKRLVENEKLKISIEQKEDLIKNQEDNLLEFRASKSELEKRLKNLDDEKLQLLANLKKLDESLNDKDKKLALFSKENSEFKTSLENLNKEKESLEVDLQKINELSKEKERKLNTLLEDILLKEQLIKTFKEKNGILEDEMKVLNVKLENTLEKHDSLTKDLASTKSKIKSLTGIKIKVISLLKQKLGKNIQIDPKNGSLRLSANILFDEGEFVLKDSSKTALKSAVYDYFQTILENKEINQHIDKIVIEGHTNSKGNFLYNLELSQKRAYSVMDFLLSQDFSKKENLRDLIVASGRSFLDPVYKDGKEDADASRRIEIKFNIKNEEAIKEIANLLE